MDYIKLSKEVSYALRHTPYEYELELDYEGFVLINQLLSALNEKSNNDRDVTKEDLEYIIKNSDKIRHKIKDDKIRALYGHSVSNRIKKEAAIPPEILYHGTAHRFIESIKVNGLLTMNRQYVHLSTDKDTALLVGKRRDNNPVLLEIDAKKAFEEGTIFYIGNDKIWLCDEVNAKYIKVI